MIYLVVTNKKILVVVLTFFLFSCSTKYKNLQITKGNKFAYEVFEDQEGIPCSCAIDMFVGENNEYIGFSYCMGLTEEDYNVAVTIPYIDSAGGTYLYYGYMNKVARNLYAVDGTFYLPSMKRCDNKIADDIDFYVYIKGKKVYFIF